MKDMDCHLLHANLALARDSLESPLTAGFIEMFEALGRIASRSPGFVSKPVAAGAGEVYQGNYLLNLSIWESVESLRQFTYSGVHAAALKNRFEWFERSTGPSYVLFWIKVGETPTELEISKRLQHLSEKAATPIAFNFKQPFTAQEACREINQ